MIFKKGKENFRSKILVNSQQAHDFSALSAVKGEYCSIFCHPDSNNLNQYQYQYFHQLKYLQPHQQSNPHQCQLQELSYKYSQTQMSLHLSLITAVSKYKQPQTKAKKIRGVGEDCSMTIFYILFLSSGNAMQIFQ